jgi:uncharacterized protein YjiS (DUF1127 family)
MIKQLSIRLAAWRREREIIRELSMLSNRELADLGIGRGDIAAIAAGHYGEPEVAPRAADAALIGPAWAAHAPTSLAA